MSSYSDHVQKLSSGYKWPTGSAAPREVGFGVSPHSPPRANHVGSVVLCGLLHLSVNSMGAGGHNWKHVPCSRPSERSLPVSSLGRWGAAGPGGPGAQRWTVSMRCQLRSRLVP